MLAQRYENKLKAKVVGVLKDFHLFSESGRAM